MNWNLIFIAGSALICANFRGKEELVILWCVCSWAIEKFAICFYSFLWGSINAFWNVDAPPSESCGSFSSALMSLTQLLWLLWYAIIASTLKKQFSDLQPINKMKNVRNLSLWSLWYIFLLLIHSSFSPAFSSLGSTLCGRPEHRPQSKSQPLLKSKHWKWLHELPAIPVESAIDGEETESAEADHGAETAASPAAADAGGCGKTFSCLLRVPVGPTEGVHYFPFLFTALFSVPTYVTATRVSWL